MVVYGWHTSKYDLQRPNGVKCNNCGQLNQMARTRYVTTFHIFFIPIFPIKVFTESDCISCKNSSGYTVLESELKTPKKKKSIQLIPIWHFSGLFLVALIFMYNWYNGQNKKKELKAKIENIEIGRIIEFQADRKEFSTYKVISTSKEKVFIFKNMYSVESIKDVDQIQIPEYYANDTVELDKTQLVQWVTDGKIKRIVWGSYDDMKK